MYRNRYRDLEENPHVQPDKLTHAQGIANMTTDILGPIRHLIGKRYVPGVKAYISELTGFTIVTGPDEITTSEVNPKRLKIRCDSTGYISSFHNG